MDYELDLDYEEAEQEQLDKYLDLEEIIKTKGYVVLLDIISNEAAKYMSKINEFAKTQEEVNEAVYGKRAIINLVKEIDAFIAYGTELKNDGEGGRKDG